MKKIVLFAALLGYFDVSTAQDTIPFMDPCFMYPKVSYYGVGPSVPMDSTIAADCDIPQRFPPFVYYLRYTADGPTSFYGIAVVTDLDSLPDDFALELCTVDETTLNPVPFASIHGGTPYFMKKMHYEYKSVGGDCRTTHPCSIYLFDNPIRTPDMDTFFTMSKVDGYDYSAVPYGHYPDSNQIYLMNPFVEEPCAFIPGVGVWTVDFWGGMFPILELPCPASVRPSVLAFLSGQTILNWSQGDTTLYRLEFYDDDGRRLFETDTLNEASFTLTDSMLKAVGRYESGYYNVRLRRACNYMSSTYHTVVWSPYSEFRRFYHQRGGNEGVVDVVMPEFAVSPNPATGSITVEGEDGELRLLDLEGREVMACPLRDGRRVIDVSALPRGVYLLRLTTAQGTASRRVVLM